jgi:thiol-disulfide isomerase/thioredoxin
MTLRLFLSGLWLVLTPWLLAATIKFDSLKVGSTTYSNVTVVGMNETDLYFKHDHGISNVKLKYLDPAVQKQLGYDALIAKEAEQQREQEQSRYSATLGQAATQEAQRAARAAKKTASTSEESLADPISAQSLLGKHGPPLQVEKWLTEKPSTTNKFVLVTFWAPWSIPSRKAIPQLNALQKKFGEKLVLIGLCAEPAEEVEQMTDAKIEFASAIDTKSKLANAVGVTSVPCVLLLDPKGVVRYQGHPAAMDEKKLEPLLTKAAE